jgi:serine/threonine protein kinase
MACLDDNLAAEFTSGSLSAAAAREVEAHLASCRDCRGLVAALAGPSEGDSAANTQPRGRMMAPPRRRETTFTVGDRIGRYLVLGRLGAGGMGLVLSAYDPQLDRKVAIKLLRTPAEDASDEARNRLIREAKATAQLGHPNVIAVYDVGTAESGDVYIAMEMVDGHTLTDWLTRWQRTWREVLEIFLQAGRGLAHAHNAGLLHRDFKPDNVLVGSDGRARVSDFGLARQVIGPDEHSNAERSLAALAGHLTATGALVGTPRYMAPEMLVGERAEPRSDQFSFCVALYECLYGRHPFVDETARSLIHHDEPAIAPPPDSRVPPAITRAILRGLARDPNRRFLTMDALLLELTPRTIRRPTKFVGVAAISLLLAGAAGAAIIGQRQPGDDPQKIHQLQQRITKLESERIVLEEALITLRNTAANDEHKIETLQSLVSEKEQEILRLQEEAKITMIEPVRPRPAPPPPAIGERITNVVASSSRELQGCFQEWSDRYPKRDAAFSVTFQISPEGKAHSARAAGMAGTTPSCAEDALVRIPFPATGKIIHVLARVTFVARQINLSADILRIEEPSVIIDLTP